MAAGRRLKLKLRYGLGIQDPSSYRKTGHPPSTFAMNFGVENITQSPQTAPHESPLSSSRPYEGVPMSLPSQQMTALSATPLSARKRRRSSHMGKTSGVLKRSASTPNVRGLATSELGMSLADKRRNKLGYHRTSVACGRYF